MILKIYGNFKQEGIGAPELLKAFGDNYISLGFTGDEYLPARDATGKYRFMTGDELGTGDDNGKVILASFGLNSAVKTYRAGVIDTMMIQLETFDAAGNPVDIGGNFQVELTLFVAGG
jgi:hypothetical protein